MVWSRIFFSSFTLVQANCTLLFLYCWSNLSDGVSQCEVGRICDWISRLNFIMRWMFTIEFVTCCRSAPIIRKKAIFFEAHNDHRVFSKSGVDCRAIFEFSLTCYITRIEPRTANSPQLFIVFWALSDPFCFLIASWSLLETNFWNKHHRINYSVAACVHGRVVLWITIEWLSE